MAPRSRQPDDWADEPDAGSDDWSPDEIDDDDDDFAGDAAEVDEGPGEHDAHLLDEEPRTVTCPACGKQVWEEAQRCHRCGHWFAGAAREGSAEAQRRRQRLALVALVTLVAFLLAAGLLWFLFLR